MVNGLVGHSPAPQQKLAMIDLQSVHVVQADVYHTLLDAAKQILRAAARERVTAGGAARLPSGMAGRRIVLNGTAYRSGRYRCHIMY